MTFKLPKIDRSVPITEEKGLPTSVFHRWFNSLVDKLEAQETQQDSILAALRLNSSFTNPVGVVTAQEDGKIFIADHTRIYGDGSSVAVQGGVVTDFTNSDVVTIYYIDTALAGGVVEYLGSLSAVPQVSGYHVVGQVTIPLVGDPDVGGAGPTAPGYTAPVYDQYYDPRAVEYLDSFGY